MKQLAEAIVVIAVLAACSTTPSPAPSHPLSVLSPPVTTPIASPTLTALRTATPSPTLVQPCVRAGAAAFPGVADGLPDGWLRRDEIVKVPDFPRTFGQVYGRDGVPVPPDEGPGRLTLFETFPASAVYLRSRVEQSRNHLGMPIAVTVCGEHTEVWRVESTGQLVVGWTDRNKSDVLVANTADFTVQELVDSAERVGDCCG